LPARDLHPTGRDKRFPIAYFRSALFPLFQALPGAICKALHKGRYAKFAIMQSFIPQARTERDRTRPSARCDRRILDIIALTSRSGDFVYQDASVSSDKPLPFRSRLRTPGPVSALTRTRKPCDDASVRRSRSTGEGASLGESPRTEQRAPKFPGT
jgi:hypothetical protein